MGNYWDPNKVSSDFELQSVDGVDNVRAYCTSDTTDQSAIGEVVADGKVYFEIHPVDFGPFVVIGICTDAHGSGDRSGFNDESWGWMENGRLYHDRNIVSEPDGFHDSDILQVAVDLDANRVWFGKNGSWIESGDPANGSNPCFDDAGITGDIFPCFSLRYADDAVDLVVEESNFIYTPPSGFAALVVSGTTEIEDFSLDLSAYYQARNDLMAILEASDGTVIHDLKTFLKTYGRSIHDLPAVLAAYFQDRQDLAAHLKTLATGRQDLAAVLRALGMGREDLGVNAKTLAWTGRDFVMALSAVRPLVFHDLAMALSATDGTIMNDLTMSLAAIKKAPQYKSVVAQRISSVISEVS